MKPKTFTYNQMIVFFEDNRAPLNDKQKALIATKVRQEMIDLEEYRKKKKEQADKKFIKREKRRLERETQKVK